MSVRVADRSESRMQYIQTARDLLKYTLQRALKLPKRYTFFITTDVVKAAQDIYRNVCIISSLYSHTDEHRAKRVSLAEDTVGILNYLASQLDFLKVYAPGIKTSQFDEWMRLILYEQKLLEGIISKNK